MSLKDEAFEAVQARLQELGWYAGKIDGATGPLSETAVSDFKRAHGLNPRAFIGPITLTRLFDPEAEARPKPKPAAIGGLPWLAEAERLKGTKEVAGKGNNRIIMDWAENLDQGYTGDDVAWCGLFVAHCMKIGAPLDPQSFNRLGAREWLKFGRAVDPQRGAILVFWRGSKNGWQGHVGFYAGEDAHAYHVLGGNQSDAVTVARIAKNRLLGARWPKSFSTSGERVTVNAGGKVISTNEA
ncbi:TIGR02594 family protein [Tianweitania sediminis]|uniref:TIGR02594 family protein n=1 Tax=Tianweitania sediminis TaxID=1502156 RepID=A0A8J7R3Z8_9HYPH|nr:TIGR02594 family protein [Tianweitania sediminis]MBP0439570.1 TIGR02594 family protein [Tianweitania sediminis]